MMGRNLVLASCLVLMIATCAAAQGGSPISLVINEVMASNSATKADPQGQYDDWIEVCNHGSVSIDAGGLYLTDDPEKPAKWQIPTTDPTLTTIAPGGHLLIWADGDTEVPGLHASFKLSADGEELRPLDAAGVTIQSFKYEDNWYDTTDGQGYSLTALAPAQSDPNQWSQKDAWRASTEFGGSPGVLDDY